MNGFNVQSDPAVVPMPSKSPYGINRPSSKQILPESVVEPQIVRESNREQKSISRKPSSATLFIKSPSKKTSEPNRRRNSTRRTKPKKYYESSDDSGDRDDDDSLNFYVQPTKQNSRRTSRRISHIHLKPNRKPETEDEEEDEDEELHREPVRPVKKWHNHYPQKPAEDPISALTAKYDALQKTVQTTSTNLTSLQSAIQMLSNKIDTLECRLKERDSNTSEDIVERIQQTLQELKCDTQWFWGKVLPNEKGHVEIYSSLEEDTKALGPNFTVPCGKWLKLSYPMKEAEDAEKRNFIWIRSQSINQETAHITNFWVKAYDDEKKTYLLGEFRFKNGVESIDIAP
jgi:hypothetical protein